jgi:putative restriction endonuclease
MSSAALLTRFDRLNIWKQGDQRAPHKPLLVLYALLHEFGPPRKSDHTAEPFWRLKNDGVWVVQAPADLPLNGPSP